MKYDFDKSPLINFGIKLPRKNTQKYHTLMFLYKNKGKVVTKKQIEQYVCGVLNIVQKDIQDGRHLSKQNGFDIIQGGNIHNNILLKRGEYVFLGFDRPNKYYSIKRRVYNNKDFDDVKKQFNYTCVTCGCKEGESHKYTGSITKLESAHKDPTKELTIDNMIPQCGYCNKKYKDKYIFDDFGQVKDYSDTGLMEFIKKNKSKIERMLNEI